MTMVKRSELAQDLTPTQADALTNWLYSDPPTVIISSGIITVDGSGWYLVQSESGVADDLIRINGCKRGEVVTISAINGHTITVVAGANLQLQNNANATLNNQYRLMNFRSFGSDILAELSFR